MASLRGHFTFLPQTSRFSPQPRLTFSCKDDDDNEVNEVSEALTNVEDLHKCLLLRFVYHYACLIYVFISYDSYMR